MEIKGFSGAIEEIKQVFNLDAIVTLDYETHFRSRADTIEVDGKKVKRKSYSLKNKAYWDYINHPEFAVTQFAYAEDDEDPIVLAPYEVDEYLQSIAQRIAEGERIGLVCQNTQFDGCISSWKFGVHWTMYFDTMLLSKQQATGQSSSLKNQCIRVFPGDTTRRKGDELVKADGVKCYFEAGIFDVIAGYNKDDVRLTRDLLRAYWLNSRTPLMEWTIIHLTLRGCIEPQFRLDRPLLQQTIELGEAKERTVITDADAFLESKGLPVEGKIQYSSDLRYQKLLRSVGLVIPMKMDKKTYEMKPALGKTDPTYVKLQQEYPEFQVLFEARKIAKSNIAVSRALKMLDCQAAIASSGQTDQIGMYLNYNAAHTGRWSGGEKINQQNLQRGSNHRLALKTPQGYVNAVCDLSNIELRMNLWFCEEDQLQQENHDGDLYCAMASEIYGEDVPPKNMWKSLDTPYEILNDKRQVGKVSELGMQYGMSGGTFQNYMAGGPMGMEPVFFSDSFCRQVKNAYDNMHPKVVQMWAAFQNIVLPVLCGDAPDTTIGRNGCVKVRKGELELPSGRILCYKDMHAKGEETRSGIRISYQYDDGTRDRFQNTVFMYTYGAKCFQNVIQALARDVVAEQQVNVEEMLSIRDWGWCIGSVHDELLNNIKDAVADEAFEEISALMRTPPAWCSNIPLDTEGGYDTVYSK